MRLSRQGRLLKDGPWRGKLALVRYIYSYIELIDMKIIMTGQTVERWAMEGQVGPG
jgi:hypothetical protein